MPHTKLRKPIKLVLIVTEKVVLEVALLRTYRSSVATVFSRLSNEWNGGYSEKCNKIKTRDVKS